MCVIVSLPPKINIPFGMLQNAVWNNPHGYGLITKGNEFKVQHEFANEVDAEALDKLLRKNDFQQRYLHLRWMTVGEINKENVHPFCIYNVDGKEVWFMHNGTLYEYAPKEENKEDKRSDSRIFADEVLIPLLRTTNGDYQSPFVQKIINKFWPYANNRGLLVSNFDKPFFINLPDWKNVKTMADNGTDELGFLASNDDYWTVLKRGPEFDRREAIEKKRKEEAQKDAAKTFPISKFFGKAESWPISKLKDMDFRPNEPISELLSDIWEDFDLYSYEGLAQLSNITDEEMRNICQADPVNAANLLLYITTEMANLVGEYDDLEEKHKKASKLIGELKQQVGATIDVSKNQ